MRFPFPCHGNQEYLTLIFEYVALRYKAYRDEQEKLHAAWRTREDARLAAIARGDPNPPPAEADPTAQHEIGLLGLLKFFLYLFVGILLAGKFVTGEWGWGLEGAVQLRKLWPTHQRLFSEDLLAKFDGRVAGRPIYLAVRVSVLTHSVC